MIIEDFVKCLNRAFPTSLEHPFARQSMNCTLYTMGLALKFRLVVSADTVNGTFISIMNEDGWNLGAYRNDNLEMVVSKIINMKDVP